MLSILVVPCHPKPEPAISATKPLKVKFVTRLSKGLVERALTKTKPGKTGRKSCLASNASQRKATP